MWIDAYDIKKYQFSLIGFCVKIRLIFDILGYTVE